MDGQISSNITQNREEPTKNRAPPAKQVIRHLGRSLGIIWKKGHDWGAYCKETLRSVTEPSKSKEEQAIAHCFLLEWGCLQNQILGNPQSSTWQETVWRESHVENKASIHRVQNKFEEAGETSKTEGI
jgi:hypothetical protein